MKKFVLLAMIVGLVCTACTSEKENATNSKKDNLQLELSTGSFESESFESLPYFELTTSTGKITSEQLLADNRPEFLLFISPN